MDHSHMDHGHMDHDMPGMDHGHGHQCNMNMLFTWSTKDLCIVFRGWHVSGTVSLIYSLLAIVLLCAGYEAVRELTRRYDAYSKVQLERRTGDDLSDPREDISNESSSLLHPGRPAGRQANEQQMKIIKAILYAVQVFYSFFIMLLFMTYNGWIMLAVAVGAFVGYMLFSNSPPTKSAACH
ncbi:Ctr copper transporter family-domain-containing protein [Lophiotrema nucula]|uniref:Copper transport protein n=1 Tax=Lophiotrema nucula TaxID=690887 RepID=A0A6A5ZIQ9_9PLEO|nr:Ctr copper transporter family-domain-containing protein [Lophiotrema nucula]